MDNRKYGMLEPFIVECRRARSYVIFQTAVNVLVAVIAFIVMGVVDDAGVGIGLVILVCDIIHYVCYILSVRTTMIGISRHFVAAHIGVFSTTDVISPTAQVVSIKHRSSFFENIFHATTLIVTMPGRMSGYAFRSMDRDSVEKFISVYQKYIISKEQPPKPQQ